MKYLVIISCLVLSSCVAAPRYQTRGHIGGGPHGAPGVSIGVGVIIGTVIASLPAKHVRLGQDNYYHDGVFYRTAPRGFEVIAAPIGQKVAYIPDQHSVIKHKNLDYYKSKGTWYRYVPSVKQYQVVIAPNVAKRR